MDDVQSGWIDAQTLSTSTSLLCRELISLGQMYDIKVIRLHGTSLTDVAAIYNRDSKHQFSVWNIEF